MGDINFYTKGEEIANAVTHGIGTLLSIAALVILIVFAVNNGDSWYIVSYSIFGASLVILYLGSTLYHSFTNQKVKKIFRVVDHSSIYILIAGTYTPFTLTILRGPLGWTIFGIVWGLTIVGITMKILWLNKFEKLSTILYILMGWIIIIAIKYIVASVPLVSAVLLVVGGVIYTVGCIFYVNNKIPYNHAIWHLFVLGGSICHFLSILLYLQ